jgi:hypothetical protein
MSTERLSKAAAIVRGRAQAATPGGWESLDNGDRLIAWQDDDSFQYVVDEPISNGANAAHIATWDPDVAVAVADWLEAEARASVDIGATLKYALTVADAILAGES